MKLAVYFDIFVVTIYLLFSQQSFTGGFYLPEIGSPGSVGTAGEGKWGHAISASALWIGDGKVDQTSQGARFKGEFDSNWMFIIGANLQYRF